MLWRVRRQDAHRVPAALDFARRLGADGSGSTYDRDSHAERDRPGPRDVTCGASGADQRADDDGQGRCGVGREKRSVSTTHGLGRGDELLHAATPPRQLLIARSRISTAVSISSRVIVSGGAIRRQLPVEPSPLTMFIESPSRRHSPDGGAERARRLLRVAVGHQFDADQQPAPAYVTDLLVALLQRERLLATGPRPAWPPARAGVPPPGVEHGEAGGGRRGSDTCVVRCRKPFSTHRSSISALVMVAPSGARPAEHLGDREDVWHMPSRPRTRPPAQKALLQAAQHRREHQPHDAWKRRHPHSPGRLSPQRQQRRLRLVQRLKDPLAVLGQHAAGNRQPHAPPGPLDQLHARLALECRQVLGDRRRRQPQRVRDRRDRPPLRSSRSTRRRETLTTMASAATRKVSGTALLADCGRRGSSARS